MKKLLALAVTVTMLIGAAAAFVILALLSFFNNGIEECDPEVLEFLGIEAAGFSPGVGPGESLNDVSGYVIPGVKLPAENIKRAGWIANVVREEGLSYRAAEIALITSYVEAGFMNPNTAQSDRDSAGPFQQRPNWGSLAERMNYRQSTLFFLYGGSTVPDGWSEPGLTDISNWQSRPQGEVAQAVQVSAFPSRYAEKLNEVKLILAHFGWTADDNQMVVVDGESYSMDYLSNCYSNNSNILDDVVTEALKQVGETYSWTTPADGASFVSAMFERVGGSGVFSDIDSLVKDSSTASGSAFATWIPADKADSFERGDVLVWGTGPSTGVTDPAKAKPERVAFFAGDMQSDVKVATYNVRGSSHTADSGPTAGPERIKTAADLIVSESLTVVGLQELQRNQRPVLLRELGSDWEIWPQQPTYDGTPGALSVNSIIWDGTQVELVQADTLPMPYYFAGKNHKSEIPVVKLRHTDTGQEFWVSNTHDPSYRENAEKRYLNAQQHARDMDRLVNTGLPVFMTGDFNSGYRPTSGGNATYQNKPENLTWCVMTRSGSMINGYDASRTPPRTGECPPETARTKSTNIIDHVYVSQDVQVSDYEEIDKSRTASDHRVVVITAGFESAAAASQRDASTIGYWVGPSGDDGVIGTKQLQPSSKLLGALRFRFEAGATMGVGSSGWVLPVDKPFQLTNHFGMKAWYYSSGSHTGQDFASKWPNMISGKPIYAIASGEITKVGWDSDGYGNYSVLTLPDGSSFLYAHQSSIVVRGGPVRTGQVIGRVGNTGKSFGAHLHLEARDSNGQIRDPITVLRSKGLDP